MINFVKTKSYNEGGNVMKTLFKTFAIIMMFAIAGCSSAYKTTTTDDVYYIPQTVRGDEPIQPEHSEGRKTVEVVNETATYSQPVNDTYTEYETVTYEETAYQNTGNEAVNDTSEYYYDEDGNMVINNFYYGDYYDFAYTSRIRRFHGPHASFGYYDPYYTNMYYYMHDPYYYGVSIYLGYGAMPYYYPGYFGFSPWYGSWYGNPFYWYGGFSPYRPFGYWGSSYWAGYHAGYYAGMYNPYGYGYWGHYDYNYNSHDGSNYHYGPRGSMGSTVDRSSAGRYTGGTGAKDSFADRFEARTAVNEDGRREIIASAADQRVSATPTPEASVRETANVTNQRPAEARVQERVRELTNSQQSREAYQPGRSVESYQTPARERYDRTTEPRYNRPQQASPNRQTPERSTNYTMPRTYTSPSYQQPSSPQRARPASATTRPATTARPSREQVSPTQRPTQRPTTQPSRTERGQPSYTPPASRQPSRPTTSPARTTPPRSTARPSGSTPSRSTASPSRSTPSRSSSPPARSSSSSRSSSSGGRNK